MKYRSPLHPLKQNKGLLRINTKEKTLILSVFLVILLKLWEENTGFPIAIFFFWV
ncbi:hypothetical protein [Streptococcus salivarius]|uniref:hypothetical protein n=1 Tax=Streptococcus salivarius TaxID=1304 RepID=UPI00321B00BE